MEIYAQGEKIVEGKMMADKIMVSQDGRKAIQKLADLRQSLKTAKIMVWQGRFMQFSEKGMEFTNCVSNVASTCPELDLVHYQEILKENGIFLQYQYFLTNKKAIEKIFGEKIKLSFEPINFPPAFIYKLQK